MPSLPSNDASSAISTGLLIALGGLPGVGKSAVASALAKRMGAVHLRIDTIEQAVRNAGVALTGAEGYRVARAVAVDNLRLGHAVVADSVNPLPVTRDLWRTAASSNGAGLVEIELICSDPVEHQRRVESRAVPIPGLVLPTWQQVLDRKYEPWSTATTVDTACRSVEETVAVVFAKLPP